MGLMDKVKAQASTLAQSANAGMAKLDAMPAQRRADTLLRNLGLAVLAERTGRATADTQTQIDQTLAELAQHEAQNNVDLVQQAAQAQAQQLQAQQARMNMQGDYLSGAPPVDPNVPPAAGGFPGQAPAGFPQQGDPSGFPGQAPAGFPQQGAPAGFPGSAQTGFPQQGDPSGFPGQAQPGFPQQGAQAGFPGTAQAGFPQQAGSAGFPGSAPAGFGDQGGFPGAAQSGFPGAAPSGFPQQGGPAGFPAADPMGFPVASDEPEPGQGQGQGQSFFPPSSGA